MQYGGALGSEGGTRPPGVRDAAVRIDRETPRSSRAYLRAALALSTDRTSLRHQRLQHGNTQGTEAPSSRQWFAYDRRRPEHVIVGGVGRATTAHGGYRQLEQEQVRAGHRGRRITTADPLGSQRRYLVDWTGLRHGSRGAPALLSGRPARYNLINNDLRFPIRSGQPRDAQPHCRRNTSVAGERSTARTASCSLGPVPNGDFWQTAANLGAMRRRARGKHAGRQTTARD